MYPWAKVFVNGASVYIGSIMMFDGVNLYGLLKSAAFDSQNDG